MTEERTVPGPSSDFVQCYQHKTGLPEVESKKEKREKEPKMNLSVFAFNCNEQRETSISCTSWRLQKRQMQEALVCLKA